MIHAVPRSNAVNAVHSNLDGTHEAEVQTHCEKAPSRRNPWRSYLGRDLWSVEARKEGGLGCRSTTYEPVFSMLAYAEDTADRCAQ